MVRKRKPSGSGDKAGWLVKGIAIYWILFIFLDFLVNSPDYLYALSFFKYSDFLVTSLLLSAGLLFPFIKKPVNGLNLTIRGFRLIYFYPVLLIIMVLFSLFFQAKNGNAGSVTGLLAKTLTIHGSVIFIFLAAYSTGAAVLNRLSSSSFGGIRVFVALGLGLVVKGILLFFLAASGNYSLYPVLVVIILMLIPGLKEVYLLFKNILLDKEAVVSLNPLSLVLIFIAIIVTAVNFVSLTTPFPLGYDSLTLYLNLPLLISNSGELAHGHMPYYWSLIMGLGYVVFDSNPVTQYLGAAGGLLAMFLIIHWSKKFFSPDWAVFSGLIFYLTPLVIWQSSIEIKTDLGMLYFGLLAVLMILGYYGSKYRDEGPEGLRSITVSKEELLLWGLAGVFSGFALGIKFTAIMAIIGLLAAFIYYRSGRFLALVWSFAAMGFLLMAELYRFADLQISSNEKWILSLLLFVTAILFFVLALRNKEKYAHLLRPLGIFSVFTILMLLPWSGKNLLEHRDFSLSNLLEGKDPTPDWFSYNEGGEDYFEGAVPVLISHSFVEEPIDYPVKLVSAEDLSAAFNESSKYEEIGRYLGYEGGAMRFFSLPYDISMKRNVDLPSTDPGLIFILFLPLLLFSGIRGKLTGWLPAFLGFLVWISLAVWSVYNPDNSGGLSAVVNNLSAGGTSSGLSVLASIEQLQLLFIYPILLLGSLISPLYGILISGGDALSLGITIAGLILLYFMFRKSLMTLDLHTRGWVLFSVLYFVIWLVLSSGIPWYGILGLAFLPAFLVKTYFDHKVSIYNENRTIKYLSSGIIFIWLLLLICLRLSPLSGGKTPTPGNIDYAPVIVPASLEFASGAIGSDEFFLRIFNEETKKIINHLNADKSKNILNIASMMRYFIEEDDRRVFDDKQLDLFVRIWNNAGTSKVATSNRFRNLGVDYILLDLDVHTLDRTPDGSLRRKVEELVSFLHNNPHVELIATDRLVEHPRGDRQIQHGGRTIWVRNDIFGTQIIETGKLALFRLR